LRPELPVCAEFIRTCLYGNPDGLFLQTTYHPFWLYANLSLEVALDVYVESDLYDLSPEVEAAAAKWPHRSADLGPFKLLDVSATCDPEGRAVAVAVVNRDQDAAHMATL
jgi:alpha-L-arabinofuranosidase